MEVTTSVPPDSPTDGTPAAQPSTGEISAAPPSGEISSEDEDLIVDEDFKNASASDIEGVLRMWTQGVMSQSMNKFSISVLFETSFVLCGRVRRRGVVVGIVDFFGLPSHLAQDQKVKVGSH